MKKIILVLFVMAQLATVASVASADGPWPVCLPCKGGVATR